MDIYQIILNAVQEYIRDTYDMELVADSLQIQKTRKDFVTIRIFESASNSGICTRGSRLQYMMIPFPMPI